MKSFNWDPNLFVNSEVVQEDVVWYDASEKPFCVYGFDRGEKDLFSCRIPEGIAKDIRPGILGMRAYAAGGRIRFGTDSSYILIRAEYGNGNVPSICSCCLTHGFDLYCCDMQGHERFCHLFRVPSLFDQESFTSLYKRRDKSETAYYTLNFPCFSEVSKLYIGLQKGSILTQGIDYINAKPVVFYGSSLTHGAAASRPGNTYTAFISQKYNLNYVNLGFAGNAKGDELMAKYIAGKEMSAFVCEYDHNAKSVEELRNTHYHFYEVFREYQKDVPFIMMSRPSFHHNPEGIGKMRSIIKESYEKAKANGDKNVYFIDGETLFEGDYVLSCTSDGVHPNDLGFYRMAKGISQVLEDILKISGGVV
ncbi:MAG: hypothetical protein IKK03_03145 [Lachnospiraceae bacterium]|nr:hypothetical protein [Lachnospiraceae bacterium]